MSWTSVRLGEIATLKYGKLPPNEGELAGAYPIFTGYRVSGFCQEYLYEEPQVIVVARGVGGTGDVKMSPEKCWITNLSIVLQVDPSRVDKQFLCYRLGREALKEKLNTGAAQAQITIENLSSYLITLPDINVQKKIAAVLLAYDDLIENNRRRMALLEDAARQLYREWFVRLRFPGYEHTPLVGGVPEGWKRISFSSIAEFVNGYPFKPEELGDEGLPVVKIPELRDGILTKTPRNTGEKIPAKYLLKDGDLLFSWSGSLLIEFWYNGPAILNQHLFRVEANELSTPSFLLLALREALPDFSNQTTGATLKHIRKSALTTVTTLLPTRILLDQFNELAATFYAQILNLRRQNMALYRARDLLLPRLMNGEITV